MAPTPSQVPSLLFVAPAQASPTASDWLKHARGKSWFGMTLIRAWLASGGSVLFSDFETGPIRGREARYWCLDEVSPAEPSQATSKRAFLNYPPVPARPLVGSLSGAGLSTHATASPTVLCPMHYLSLTPYESLAHWLSMAFFSEEAWYRG